MVHLAANARLPLRAEAWRSSAAMSLVRTSSDHRCTDAGNADVTQVSSDGVTQPLRLDVEEGPDG